MKVISEKEIKQENMVMAAIKNAEENFEGSGEYDSGTEVDSDGDPKWYNDIDDGMWNAPD